MLKRTVYLPDALNGVRRLICELITFCCDINIDLADEPYIIR